MKKCIFVIFSRYFSLHLFLSQEYIDMEAKDNTTYLVSGYELNEEELLSLLQDPAFYKYSAIAKS